jgi:hypothetical protein
MQRRPLSFGSAARQGRNMARRGMMATIDWAAKQDEEVFGGSEQPGSQFAYERGLEIQRRLYLLQKTAAEQQVLAIAEQREATMAQREAIAEMRRQSTIMFWSVIGIFVTALVTLVAAFIN